MAHDSEVPRPEVHELGYGDVLQRQLRTGELVGGKRRRLVDDHPQGVASGSLAVCVQNTLQQLRGLLARQVHLSLPLVPRHRVATESEAVALRGEGIGPCSFEGTELTARLALHVQTTVAACATIFNAADAVPRVRAGREPVLGSASLLARNFRAGWRGRPPTPDGGDRAVMRTRWRTSGTCEHHTGTDVYPTKHDARRVP